VDQPEDDRQYSLLLYLVYPMVQVVKKRSILRSDGINHQGDSMTWLFTSNDLSQSIVTSLLKILEYASLQHDSI